MENENNKLELKKFDFKWRSWYWYFALTTTSLIVIFLAIFMILFSHVKASMLQTALYPLYIAITSTIIVFFATIYIWLVNKDYLFHKNKIRITKYKFLINGMTFVFLSILLYLMTTMIGYFVAKNFQIQNLAVQQIDPSLGRIILFPGNVSSVGFLGIMLGFIIIVNFIGVLFWTFFQFGLAYDIFKYNNHDYIEKLSLAKSNYHHQWDQIALKNNVKNVKKGINKWTYFVNDYESQKKENNENK